MRRFPAQAGLAQRLTTALAKVALALRTQSWQRAGRRGLTPTQGQFLAELLRAGPGQPRLREVAAALGVTSATASDCLRSLEQKRLVRRAPAADDARALRLALTPRGRHEAERAAGFAGFLAEAATQLEPAEQQALYAGILKLIRALQLKGQIPVSRMCVACRFFEPNAHPGAAEPHHCAFVDAAFSDRELRIDCGDYEPAA